MSRALLLLSCLALLAHAPGLANGFVYDDHRFVAGNAALDELSWTRALLDPSTHTTDRDRDVYRPLRALGHAFDRARWGDDPFGFHLHSILAHVACVLLAYLVLRTMLGGQQSLAAFAGAGLLAVHPLGVEVVGWVSSRGDQYAVLFGLAALGCATFLARTARTGGRSAWRAGLVTVGAAVCAALATLGKESAAVLPVVVLLALRVPSASGATSAAASSEPGGERRGRLGSWRGVAALGCGVAAALVLRQIALAGASPVQTPPHGGSALAQAAWAFHGLARTAAHIVWPSDLSVEYDQAAWSAAGPGVWLGGAAVGAALVLGTWRLGRRAPTAAFLLGWALLAYLPSSSLMVTLRNLVNDRMAYPLLAPVGAALGLGLSHALSRAPRGADVAVVAALLLGCLPPTWSRTADFRSDEALWTHELAERPHAALAWVGLAHALAERDPSAAGAALARAVEVAAPGSKPEAVALARLGDHLLRRDEDATAARPILERAARAARRWRERALPTTDELATAASLAEALTVLRRYDEAEDVLARMIAEEPQPAVLWLKLSVLREQRAVREDDPTFIARAWDALEQAARLSPEHPLVRARWRYAELHLPRGTQATR